MEHTTETERFVECDEFLFERSCERNLDWRNKKGKFQWNSVEFYSDRILLLPQV